LRNTVAVKIFDWIIMKCATLILAAAIGLASGLPPAMAKPKPAPAMPAGPDKLTQLVTFDQVVGKGKLAAAGSTVTIHYTGWLYVPKAPKQRGAAFDTSVGATPHTFTLGTGAVIKGWDEGVLGMRAGGKRTLLVPASMGFGKEGLGPVPPTASMVFDVELLKVK
jgi:FKBP-type peptidyl-prolyl cis-trans isomerase FkpA